MTVEALLILALLVRLCTWFLQTSGMFPMLGEFFQGFLVLLPTSGEQREWLRGKGQEFWSCDLCLGFWVSLVLLAVWRIRSDVLLPFEALLGFRLTLPIAAGGLALVVHVFRLGWQSKWSIMVVGGPEQLTD